MQEERAQIEKRGQLANRCEPFVRSCIGYGTPLWHRRQPGI